MIDSGESLPISRTVKIKDDLLRGLKTDSLEAKASNLTWSKSITGRRVDFPQPDGKLVWGIEIDIPLYFEEAAGIYKDALRKLSNDSKTILTDEEIEKAAEKKRKERFYGDTAEAKLPGNIRKIRILDLSPQETLPKHLRNIDSQADFYHNVYLKMLAAQPSDSPLGKMMQFLGANLNAPLTDNMRRKEALDKLFKDVFGGDSEKARLFESVIGKSQADGILFILGHGGSDNTVGEETWKVKGKDAEKQSPGNWIDLSEVIKKYDDPHRFGAILVSSCYSGNNAPPGGKVRVFRPRGISGGITKVVNLNPTYVSMPEPER